MTVIDLPRSSGPRLLPEEIGAIFGNEYPLYKLFEASAFNSKANTSALLGIFHNIRQASDKQKAGVSTHFHVTRAVIQLLTDHIATRYGDLLFARDKDRFSALRTAAILIARSMDAREFDATKREILIPHYHNNVHSQEVTLTGFPVDRVNYIKSGNHELHDRHGNAIDITPLDLMLLTVARLGHDFMHPGKGNMVDGAYHPLHQERPTFEALKTIFDMAGVSEENQETIRLIIYGTDPFLPSQITRYANSLHFKAPPHCRYLVMSADQITNKIAEHDQHNQYWLNQLFNRLRDDPKQTLLNASTDSADLGLSFGISPSYNFINAARYQAELIAAGKNAEFAYLAGKNKGKVNAPSQLQAAHEYAGVMICNDPDYPHLRIAMMTPGGEMILGPNSARIENSLIKAMRPEEKIEHVRYLQGVYGRHVPAF